ncbi:MAG: aldehyde ferredoxin oxidoreductase family protein [Desulfosarcinaceae bacterium]|nr:aldehyde ferredoxin oxidoreductase family protein [Desulfosarcinaceae bacterium]
MKGYTKTILRVNLTTGKISEDHPDDAFYTHFLGGTGFIVHTLLTEMAPNVDPLGEDNKLIFALGPVTGHKVPGSGRNVVGAKSPLTNAYGEAEAGGFFGAELRRCGYDALIVEGKAAQPVYILARNNQVEIKDAQHLWGLDVADAVNKVQDELEIKALRTAAIGPGGEQLVRYASVQNDVMHSAGRTGMGAVMGSKNLKLVALKGSIDPPAHDTEKVQELSKWMTANYKKITEFPWKWGTGPTMVKYEQTGNMPINNFKGGPFPTIANIAVQAMFEKGYIVKRPTCYRCPLKCKRSVRVETPWNSDPAYGAPQYETLVAFGCNCGVDNLEAVIKANEICNRYSIDTISTGVAISFAMELFEEGILTTADTDGMTLRFGDAEAMLTLTEKIGKREGTFATLLGEGVKIAAERIGKGAMEYAMHVKGEEIAMHEPRYKQGMGLHYSVHASGPDHVAGIHDEKVASNLPAWEEIDVPEEISNLELSPRKARMLYQVGLWRQLCNYLGLCAFIPYKKKQIGDLVEYITGMKMSHWRLMKTVERGITLCRLFNLREGFTKADDVLPKRFNTSPESGPLKGVTYDPSKHEDSREVYYQMLGWDGEGVPTRGRLVELNLEWAEQYLPKSA